MLTAAFLTEADLSEVEPTHLEQLVTMQRAGTMDVARAPGERPPSVVFAAERLPELRAIHADAPVTGNPAPPPSRLAKSWTRADAVAEVLRGRLSITGPVTAEALAHSLGVPTSEADGALLVLESEGVVLRGRFTPGARDLEWCDRTLLARIHRYTLHRLRAEIEPVSAADFMRFLFRWQHLESSFETHRARRAPRDRGDARRLRAQRRRLGARRPAVASGPLRAVDARHALPVRRSRMGTPFCDPIGGIAARGTRAGDTRSHSSCVSTPERGRRCGRWAEKHRC